MHIYEENEDLLVLEVEDFLLSQTLECGQCFHYKKLEEEDYALVSGSRYLHVSQTGSSLRFHGINREEYLTYWEHYFDLQKNYREIKDRLLEKDNTLAESIEELWGMRILNQDFFETMISFIISQNQQIPRIRQIIENICERFGTPCENGLYTFPSASCMIKGGEAAIRECKAGFRSAYIIDACERFQRGELLAALQPESDYESCMSVLKTVKGIGDKVANCIVLFALDKRNAFPVDVWIKRVMETLYFQREATIPEIQKRALEQFGDLGGYAQQYLFFTGIRNGIGKNVEKVSKSEKKRDNLRK